MPSSKQRLEVWKGLRKKTSGGLTKEHLTKNKRGKIVSKKKSGQAFAQNNLGSFLREKGKKVAKADILRKKGKPPSEEPKPKKPAVKPKAKAAPKPSPKPAAPKVQAPAQETQGQTQGRRKETQGSRGKEKSQDKPPQSMIRVSATAVAAHSRFLQGRSTGWSTFFGIPFY